MIASCNPISREQRLGLVIILECGTRIRPDEVKTSAQAQALLDEVDRVIEDIERQLEDDLSQPDDPGWRVRAEHALKMKRRGREVLAQRLAQVRRAEDGYVNPKAERLGARRIAFINAAEAMLDHEQFVEIWQRAAEGNPETFKDWKGIAP